MGFEMATDPRRLSTMVHRLGRFSRQQIPPSNHPRRPRHERHHQAIAYFVARQSSWQLRAKAAGCSSRRIPGRDEAGTGDDQPVAKRIWPVEPRSDVRQSHGEPGRNDVRGRQVQHSVSGDITEPQSHRSGIYRCDEHAGLKIRRRRSLANPPLDKSKSTCSPEHLPRAASARRKTQNCGAWVVASEWTATAAWWDAW